MDDRDKYPPPFTLQDELDYFWAIDDLLPPSGYPARSRPISHSRATPTAVEMEIPPRQLPVETTLAATAPVRETALTHDRDAPPCPTEDKTVTHYIPPHTAAEVNGDGNAPLLEYHPEGVLIHRVRVFDWKSGYHYFDQFIQDAAHYAALPAPSVASPEPFFSYFPQYTQLNRRAVAWYLYWREQVRAGRYPSTDYAYILLYLFELLNLAVPDAETARRHRDLMAAVWVAYRPTYPQLDHYMCEWLCDYCLIHAEPAPLDLLAPALDDIIEGSRLKEFYLTPVVSAVSTADVGHTRPHTTARILLRHCCQYDYRKSKFAAGEHRPLFDRLVPAAVAATLPLLLGGEGRPPVITMLESTVTRDAYTGALCAYQNKRRIEVAYTSFSRSHELRFLIGDMVKHIENRIRAALGVRSRLSVMSLPIPLRQALDAYLATCSELDRTPPVKKKDTPRPAYEALYDLPHKELSVTDAAAIEAQSWATTRILVEAFEGDAIAEEMPLPSVESPLLTDAWDIAPAPTAHAEPADALLPYLPFLRAVLNGDAAAARAFVSAQHKMPDAVADEINAITAETVICDIILEDDGTGIYTVLDDYRDEVETIIRRLSNT